MPYTGRCACGAVTLEIAGDPIATRQCWCRQCQQIAASGNTLTHHFCPGCGTQVYGQSSARLHLKTVRFGVIDEPHGLAPEAAIWLAEAPAWAQVDPAIEQWQGQPPAPASPPPAAS